MYLYVSGFLHHSIVSFNACLSDVKFNESKLLWTFSENATLNHVSTKWYFWLVNGLMDETILDVRSATSWYTKIIDHIEYLLQHLKIVHRSRRK